MTNKEDLKTLLEYFYYQGKTPIIPKEQAEVILNNLEKDLEVLQQYKKLEEQLGIDLITLFKPLQNGLYYTKKHFISKQLAYISYELYDKDWCDLTPEERTEFAGVILSVILDNMVGYEGNFEEPMLKEK